MAPRVKTSELWRHIAKLRARKAYSTPTGAGAAMAAAVHLDARDRADRNAATAEVSEHWAATGWHQPGASMGRDAPQGRGWHDAGQPSKLP